MLASLRVAPVPRYARPLTGPLPRRRGRSGAGVRGQAPPKEVIVWTIKITWRGDHGEVYEDIYYSETEYVADVVDDLFDRYGESVVSLTIQR